jgi:hypothetical protein
MTTKLATAEICEFDEYQEVVMRIFTTRGSTPIRIVDELKGLLSAEEIGKQIIHAFDYFIESPIVNAERGGMHTW